ncbi:MAG TPA: DNA cytosine methyltransferase [Chakrabartia sp.]|nr:DNA cytosine methyltransferase [Chakrabartia sp.]
MGKIAKTPFLALDSAKSSFVDSGPLGLLPNDSTKRPMRCVSLFSGAGGLDIGLEDAGFSTIFASDIESHVCETLRQNKKLADLNASEFDVWFENFVAEQRCYRNAKASDLTQLKMRLWAESARRHQYLKAAVIHESDVRELTAQHVLDVTGFGPDEIDLIAGGPPCQPFSRAGKREMMACDKGQLFMDFVRLVDGIRPRWFLFENVKGLVVHKSDLAHSVCQGCGTTQLLSFERRDAFRDTPEATLACEECDGPREHQICWSSKRGGALDIIRAEFERLGYYCHDKILNAADFGAPQSRERLFIVGSRDHEPFSWPDPSHRDPKLQDDGILTLFENGVKLPPWTTARQALFSNGHWRYGQLDPEKSVLWVKNVVRPHDEPVTWSLDRIAPTVGAHQSAKLAIAPYGVPEKQLARQQWHVLGRRQGDTPPVPVEHEYLTDAELLALQTFPENWYLHGTRMERAFQIGNAVPPVLACALGKAILAAMGATTTEKGQLLAYA